MLRFDVRYFELYATLSLAYMPCECVRYGILSLAYMHVWVCAIVRVGIVFALPCVGGCISSPVRHNASCPHGHTQLAATERVQGCLSCLLPLADGPSDSIELLSPLQLQHAAFCLQMAGMIAFTAAPGRFHLLHISWPDTKQKQVRAQTVSGHPLHYYGLSKTEVIQVRLALNNHNRGKTNTGHNENSANWS